MRNPFKRFKPRLPDRQTVSVSTKSWHGRLYSFWRQHAKYKAGPSYKENLCHYVRVILIWAPIAAFLHAHSHRWPIVTPATVLLAASMFTGGAYAAYNYPSDLGKVLLIIAASTVAAFLFMGALYVIEGHHREISRWVGKSRGGRFFKWIGRGVGNATEAVFDFFAELVFALVAAGEAIKRWRARRSPRTPRVRHGDGLGTVLGQYLVARKGKICPFIEIDS